MKITKSRLKQLIREELQSALEEGGAMGHLPRPMMDTRLARDLNNPSDWVEIANTLRQMSKVWRDGEDGAILQVAADILQGAADHVDAQDPLMGGDTDPLYDTTKPLKLPTSSRMDAWELKNKLGIGNKP